MDSLAIRARNHVTVSGQSSAPLLFLHGLGCDQRMWRHAAPAFEAEHQVVLMDFVGSGRSDLQAYDSRRYGHLSGYAQDVLEVCEALDLQDVVLVGHSIASMVAMEAVIEDASRVKAVVMVGPSPHFMNDPPDYRGGFEEEQIRALLDLMADNFSAWASVVAPLAMGLPVTSPWTVELKQSFCQNQPDILAEFARVAFLCDERDRLHLMPRPSLILQCREDALAPDAVGEFMHRHLKGSHLHRLQATGHCPHVTAPAETVAAIQAYVTSLAD